MLFMKPSHNTQHNEKPGLKMQELTETTGTAKSTILYYLSLGLIPEPVKTSRNMSWYAPECIDRIRFIQTMKTQHRLSLAEIKDLLDELGDGDPLNTHLKLSESVFGRSAEKEVIDARSFRDITGLSSEQLTELLDKRLLIPGDENSFDPDDIAMGKALAQGLSWGYRADDFIFYVEAGEQIVKQELGLREKITTELSLEEDAQMTLKMIESARISRIYIIDRIFRQRISRMKGLKEPSKKEPS